MTMKSDDLKSATSLLLQGFLRANEDNTLSGLAHAILAMRLELADWEENLEGTPRLLAIARGAR